MGSERFEKAFAKGDTDGSGTIGKFLQLNDSSWLFPLEMFQWNPYLFEIQAIF